MPASDPTTDVPTPTGTLQGVAAFSWDGSAWQPTGRAGPSVATPTGVLRGVAQFSGGPSWQPSGRAQPGVTTPTGTLEGVAVYTWSGSAWTPPGGTATPSTPSGALRGVAAFNWDGAAWQPAAQAGPSVATPYGVLDGVAMFGWSGSAWAAVGAPSLSLSFMQPGTLDPHITFTRASTATYFDNTGTMQTATANAPRWDYDPATHALQGLLIEEARTNLLLNSAALGTQGVAVTAQAYTLSFYGTGTITKSGAASGALAGTGAFPQRVSQTFTPTAGTLTLTVTGSVLNAQLEAGSFVTSWIPTTAAAVTRAQDQCSILPANMGFYAPPGGSWAAEFICFWNLPTASVRIIAAPNTAGGPTPLYETASNTLSIYDGVVFPATTNTMFANAVHKGASAISGAGSVCLDGGPVATQAGASGFPNLGTTGIAFFTPNPSSENMNGYLRRVTYWPRVLSNAEMQAVTT